jgi:hypothetical protein
MPEIETHARLITTMHQEILLIESNSKSKSPVACVQQISTTTVNENALKSILEVQWRPPNGNSLSCLVLQKDSRILNGCTLYVFGVIASLGELSYAVAYKQRYYSAHLWYL